MAGLGRVAAEGTVKVVCKKGGVYFRELMVHVDLYCVHYLMAYDVESLKVELHR